MIRRRTPLKRTPIKRSTTQLKRVPVKKRRTKPRKVSADRNQKYKTWLKSKPCAVCGATPSDPAHCGKNNGMASKGNDRDCAPLCRFPHHREFDHGMNGKRGFQEKYAVDMLKIAQAWYARYCQEKGL